MMSEMVNIGPRITLITRIIFIDLYMIFRKIIYKSTEENY